MAQETSQQLWRALRLYCPTLPVALAQNFIKYRFREIRYRKLWSWRIGQSQFLTYDVYKTGTASVVRGSNIVTGTATAWDPSLLGRQFRVGTIAPVYTVAAVDSATQIQIDQVYGGPSNLNVGYQILTAYITPTPTDFQDFLSVKDTSMNWRLRTHVPQKYLDSIDAQRSNSGTPYCLADLAYNNTTNPSGSVNPCVQVVGAGPSPFSSGLYTGFSLSTYVIKITLGGAVGTATFQWKKDNGSFSVDLPTSTQPIPFDAGVSIQFPTGVYVLNDTFVIQVTPGYQSAMPMFELWPYQLSARVYPYLYDKRFPDTDDPNWALPRYIDGDTMIWGALADICRWAGLPDMKNPMYSLDAAKQWEAKFEGKIDQMEREDEEVYSTLVQYDLNLPYASAMWPGADFMQDHDFTAGG
jgi:hypothetical protein